MTISRRTVLFVDDEPNILNALRRTLHNEPYKKIFEDIGTKALKTIEEEEIHVVVSDMFMLGMDGHELLRKAKEIRPEIVSIILSASDDKESILNAVTGGNVDRYLLKPWDEEELKYTIRQAIEQYDMQKEDPKTV